jgi:rubrerythrin
MEEKRFIKNDQGFICKNCGRNVLHLSKTSRNHCPYCLYSLHVDNNPGDRKNDCGGLMEPIGIEAGGKRGYVIIHKCTKCGVIKKNKAAVAGVEPDDMNVIIKLSAAQY